MSVKKIKIFFVSGEFSVLADTKSTILESTKKALLKLEGIEEVKDPAIADALLLQEKFSYKDFRYTPQLLHDPFLSKYIPKLFTLNFDDCATGLLRGLYSNIPKSRLINFLHVAVPYTDYFNETVFAENYENHNPAFLATWRGNSSSNSIRPPMVKILQPEPRLCIELTNSWLNHPPQEKLEYVNLILNGKFSLCPAGFAASSFRIYESMALGRCPVIIADEFAPPAGPDWNKFALFCPQNKIKDLYQFLLQHEPEAMQLGMNAKEAWNNYFKKDILPDYYADSLVTLIRNTPDCTVASEMKRWKSFNFYWNNGWTLPQRILHKINHSKLLSH